jgi:hypothetical protein
MVFKRRDFSEKKGLEPQLPPSHVLLLMINVFTRGEFYRLICTPLTP